MRSSPRRLFLVLGLLLAATVLGVPLLGSADVRLDQVLWTLRAPRLVLALLAGCSLSLAGATFQATFRNPLATPFTLGVASGASLFVAIAVVLGQEGMWWMTSLHTVYAFAGAALTVLIVYAIALSQGNLGTGTLLLAGVAIAFLCTAGIVLVQALAAEMAAREIIRWMMGSLVIVGREGWWSMLPAAGVLLVAGGIIARLHRDLDVLMMGELVAASRGVHVKRARTTAYFAASALTAATVALCGPIAFVGLMVPHAMRYLVGPRHAVLLPACALGGMIFLPVCDAVAHNLLPWLSQAGVLTFLGFPPSTSELPVGVLTSLLGGGFFLYLLLTRRRRASPL